MEFQHYSVLLEETIEELKIRPDGVYVDGTVGGGGHALEIAKHLTGGHLIGMDQDADALTAARERLADVSDKVTLVRANYETMAETLHSLGYEKADGILLDLGVSSFQLDTPQRGFSYMAKDAPLDMRMDQRNPKTAYDIVNQYAEEELYRILRDYGEERFARNIAANIVRERKEHPIRTAGELNAIIAASIPKKVQLSGGHPSKRTFQAIRIELNRELDVLQEHLDEFIDLLTDGGRLCVITFHSLEDRIVKTLMKQNQDPCICPKEFPVCVCGRVSKGEVITKKPILPGRKELEENSRSRSAKLRVFERKIR